jgi:hypothetical protein
MIVHFSGVDDNAVCIAVSGRQTSWTYNVTPGKYFEDPLHKPTGAYAKSLGEGSSRLQRGHLIYQTMGHTALFVRTNGTRREPVVGFFPKEGLLGSLTPGGLTAKEGQSVEGAWHNDGWIFDDNAALAYEIPCSFLAATTIRNFLQNKMRFPDTQFQYQTRQTPGDSETASRNCVAAAMLLLEDIWALCLRGAEPIDQRARKEVKRVTKQMKNLLSERGFLQGQMQQLVQTGFTHLPTEGP